MQKAAALFLILLMGFSALLYAQDDSEPSVEPDWDDFKYELYSKGDQTLFISFLIGFPITFLNQGEKIDLQITPPIGGTGSLSYIYYLNSRLFAGGEVSLLCFPTVRENTVYIISFGARVGSQFLLGKFEFPFFLTLGGTVQTYLDFGYFGYYMKAGASALYRATPEWSFGIMSNFCWYPQWIRDDPAKNVDGFFVDLSLVARYHF